MNAGLLPKAALALVRAGLRSLVDLEGLTREDLLAIAGVGRTALERIEEALGEPFPGTPARNNRLPPWPETVWRRRGLQIEAAITFAQMGMTVERLKSMTREELLSLRGVGIGTLQACELILGREIPAGRTIDTAEAFWRGQGIPVRAARALSRAGIRSLAELRERSREDLLTLRSLGENTLLRLEALLEARIPSRADYWLDRGLSAGVANVLLREGIKTLADLGRLTREELLALPGFGHSALRQCERLLRRILPFQRRGTPAS